MADRQRPAPEDVIGMEEAISLLEVAPDGVQVMIDGGLLNPVPGPGQLRFYQGEVIAAREQGG